MAAFLVLMLAACAALAQEGFPRLLDARERISRPDVVSPVRVRILTSIDFPPFNFADQTGRLSGFNVDLAREICTELKIEAKCQIQALPFEEIEKVLESGAAEAAMAGIAITPELRKRFLFSRSYLNLPARFAISKTAKIEGETVEALRGKPVGVVAGTAHERMLKAFFPALEPRPFENQDAMLEALKKGEIAAVFSDGLRLPFWVAGEASAKCCSLFGGPYVSERFLGEGLAVMIRKGDPQLAVAIDQALAVLSRNGRLEDIYFRYFPHGLY